VDKRSGLTKVFSSPYGKLLKQLKPSVVEGGLDGRDSPRPSGCGCASRSSVARPAST